MANNKKFVEAITSMNEDFAKWYTDIVKKAELVDYSSVKGCMIIRPYGYAIWENIQKILDEKLKATDHENVYMPMFIPESLLQKEKDHVEGFAPEVAWVTHGGSEPLAERLCVRPTSETLFCEHYAKIVQSHNDLPKLYNQWCSVVRWEKTTRPFLRTDKEKFAGARATYTIESLMHDGKALQNGTSHNFGDGFAKTFNIRYNDKNGKLQYVHETSWGVTTRLIGALIMVHGDDSGLVLPPRIAPTQVMIIPIAQHKEGVLDKATELKDRVSKIARVKLDCSDKMPGWKFSECEMKGIPLRVEIGPKDIENNQAVIVRRDTREKLMVSLDELETKITETLELMQVELLEKARASANEKTYSATTLDEFMDIANNKPGFIKAMWCGDLQCEEKLKEVAGVSSRCMPFEQEELSSKCICCGKEAKTLVYWGKAY